MAYFKICPYCGASLDPNEKCDCQEIKEAKKREIESATHFDAKGQMTLNTEESLDEKVS